MIMRHEIYSLSRLGYYRCVRLSFTTSKYSFLRVSVILPRPVANQLEIPKKPYDYRSNRANLEYSDQKGQRQN